MMSITAPINKAAIILSFSVMDKIYAITCWFTVNLLMPQLH